MTGGTGDDDPLGVGELVARCLAEDVGTGDLTAALIDPAARSRARVLARESAVLCGRGWVDEVFRQLGDEVRIEWLLDDGAHLAPDTVVCRLQGPARALLTGERSALNLLQTLSGTATQARRYADRLAGSRTRVLDTRKTLPGMRAAQKYAVRCGGGTNHRTGLYDGILIKENHLRAAGGVAAAVASARSLHPGLPVEVEVEDLGQLDDALGAGAEQVLLDNFDLQAMAEAVRRTAGRATLEASGNITLERLEEIAATGVDFISVGAVTKHLRAVDFSMLFD